MKEFKCGLTMNGLTLIDYLASCDVYFSGGTDAEKTKDSNEDDEDVVDREDEEILGFLMRREYT